MSPLSPSLCGDSSSGQAIPACFGHAPLYYPGNDWLCDGISTICKFAMRPAITGGGGGGGACSVGAQLLEGRVGGNEMSGGEVQVRLRWGRMWRIGGGELAELMIEFVELWAVMHCSWRASPCLCMFDAAFLMAVLSLSAACRSLPLC